ncbi:MAG: FxsA family protein [Rhodothermales bacterium]
MFGRLLLLFLIVPIVELALLIEVGRQIGFLPTVGLIVVTALVGSFLAKREGIATWMRLQKRMLTGQLPSQELLDGAIILISGAFLLTPGVLTDVVGVMGLLPFTRAWARPKLQKWLGSKVKTVNVSAFGRSPFGGAPQHNDASSQWQGAPEEVPSYLREEQPRP